MVHIEKKSYSGIQIIEISKKNYNQSKNRAKKIGKLSSFTKTYLSGPKEKLFLYVWFLNDTIDWGLKQNIGESQARLKNSKILELLLKNAFREQVLKMFYPIFWEFNVFEKFARKRKSHLYLIKYAKNIGKIDKVLGIRIETIYNFRTRDKLSIRASPFLYLATGVFLIFQVFWRVQSTVKELPFQAPMETLKVAYFYESKTHLGMPDIESKLILR